MAKTPKAPGKNGPSTPLTLIDAFEGLASTLLDEHWRAEILAASLAPVAKIAGEARARMLLERLKTYPHWHARGAFNLARGLALRGDTDARRVVHEAEALSTHDEIQGQFGTLVWIDAARAFHALGLEGDCDRALDTALEYALREVHYPSQPRPWLAVGYARTGRVHRVLADLRERVPNQRVSFHDEHALRLGVEHAVTRGDVSMFAAIHAEQTAHNGYSIAEALAESAVESAKNGHADALVAMCTVFASDRSYGARTMVRIAWTLAETGEIALARRVIEATRDACLEEVSGHDRFLAVIETPFAHPAKVPTGRALVQYIRVGHRIDPEGASALAQQRESALLSAITATSASVSQAVEELGFLGVAIAAAGLRDRGGALLSTAIQAAQTLDRGAMSSVLKTLALAAVEHGLGEQAHAAFKKIATKSYKVEVAQALSVLYVQDGDFAGASMILANGDPRPIWQMMRHCDALSIAAGTERAFLNHV